MCSSSGGKKFGSYSFLVTAYSSYMIPSFFCLFVLNIEVPALDFVFVCLLLDANVPEAVTRMLSENVPARTSSSPRPDVHTFSVSIYIRPLIGRKTHWDGDTIGMCPRAVDKDTHVNTSCHYTLQVGRGGGGDNPRASSGPRRSCRLTNLPRSALSALIPPPPPRA